MKAIVFTPSSLFRLSQYSISEEWFTEYSAPTETDAIKRVVIGDIVYLIECEIDNDDRPIVVINISEGDGVFAPGRNNVPVLDRIITMARYEYTSSVKIPTTWRHYHEKNILSIYASSRNKVRGARLHFNIHPEGTEDLFVFAHTDDTVDFSTLPLMTQVYTEARSNYAAAILTTAPVGDQTRAGIVLTERLPQGFVQGATLDQWYNSKLTTEQRCFVEKPYDGPVRLRGSAGTGKTLSLVVKFLRDATQFETNNEDKRLAFLTHSEASVDLVSAIAENLDSLDLLSKRECCCKVEIRTLYDLAQQHLHFNLNKLQPLSLDGREGRILQFEIIEDVLKEMARSKVLKLQFSDLTSDIKARWLATGDHRFIAEIMNEFGSVLDAESIRSGEERGEKYVKGSCHRPAWLMKLPSENDRRFLLEVHRRYRNILGEMGTLSVDQMVADFNAFLDSNRWDRIRNRDGYDALFVDELHLFTYIERQTFHKLIKPAYDEKGVLKRPPIFMAYDLKQSPGDTFTQYGETDKSLFTATTGLQHSELIKLNQVFRYTPQIAEFLTDLDAAFPAMDIPGEWDAYSGKAQLDNGNVPELTVFKGELELFKSVFREATRCARLAKDGGRRVAILCPSEEMFGKYLMAASGQFEDNFFPITSREVSSELRHTRKRFIFSMPEYVAGLQFETVFLIHVDSQEALADASLGARRRFISSVYLGSSRAEQTLRISACNSRGGASDILNMALSRKSLRQVL